MIEFASSLACALVLGLVGVLARWMESRLSNSGSGLKAGGTEAGAEAPAEPAAPAPAPAPAAFDPDKVFKVDESPLMAYISRSWNKLDGSDTVEVEEMLGAASP